MDSKKKERADTVLETLAFPVMEEDHHVNSIGAKYTLVEYGDYECPDCEMGSHVVKELLRDLGEDLCYVFRNFPVTTVHPNAQFAAEAAEAADAQGKFWLMHDRLFEHQTELSPPRIRQLAKEISLDVHRFELDLQSGEPRRRVQEDRAGGIQSGVEGTPTFFANGRMQVGSYEYHALFEALTSAARVSG
jgi:protein-disulfide isomerase